MAKPYKSDLLNSLVGKNKIGKIRNQAMLYGIQSLTPFQRRVYDDMEKELTRENKGGVVKKVRIF